MAIIRDQVDFLHVLIDVCGVTSDSLGENFHCELSTKLNYNHELFLQCIQEDFGCHLDEMFRSVCSKHCWREIMIRCCFQTDESSENTEDEIQSINVKLFLWAVFFDHYQLSLHFWHRLNVSIPSKSVDESDE